VDVAVGRIEGTTFADGVMGEDISQSYFSLLASAVHGGLIGSPTNARAPPPEPTSSNLRPSIELLGELSVQPKILRPLVALQNSCMSRVLCSNALKSSDPVTPPRPCLRNRILSRNWIARDLQKSLAFATSEMTYTADPLNSRHFGIRVLESRLVKFLGRQRALHPPTDSSEVPVG